MSATYTQLFPFPSSLNSCPVPVTSSAFSPHAASGFQCKYSFVSATHRQCSAKFGQSMLLPGKTLSQVVKCPAHQLVLWICCLNLHRPRTWVKVGKQHRCGFFSYLCRLPKHCCESKTYVAYFSQACQNTFPIQELWLANGQPPWAQTCLGSIGRSKTVPVT